MLSESLTSDERQWHADAVARVLGGDVEAYSDLIGRHRDRLHRYAMRMLSDSDEAQDVTQETFVRAYRSLHTCEDPSRFGGWIFSILANRCRTAGAKRVKREAVFVAMDAAPEQWGNTQHDSESAMPAESAERMESALETINASHREAFLLKFVEELSYEEMAALTGVGVSALKMRVSRAREALRAKLKEAYND